MVLRYWLAILKRGFLEASQYVALHKFWVALAPATLAPLYLWRVFGIRSVTNFWKIALSAAMGYATTFVFAIFWKLITVPAALHVERLAEANKESAKHKLNIENLSAEFKAKLTQQAESHTSQIDKLKTEVASLHESAQADRERRLVNLSLSIRTEELPHPIMMGTGQDSFGQPFQVHVTVMTLLIYNHGKKPVVLRECNLWKIHSTQQTKIPLHGVVTSAAPVCVDITEQLVRTISDTSTLNFTSLQGKYTVRIVITYCEGSKTGGLVPIFETNS